MFSSIMVSCDRTAACGDRVALAADLARRFDAHLTGVGARVVDSPLYAGGELMLAYSDLERFALSEVEDVRRTFETRAGRSNKIGWRQALTDPTGQLNVESRAADLIVVGRRGTDDDFDTQMGANPGEVVLGAGRPVLVTPPRMHSLTLKSVAIAWKDTREARRALRDAVPLLRLAAEIHIIEITSGPATPVNARDVAWWLAGQGLQAEVHADPARQDREGATFMEQACLVEADMIVSGGYGRSRLREFVFGGFTRDLLQDTGVCCLMSN